MIKENYISFNGKIFTENNFKFDINNRAFLYGDGLFETMRASSGKIHFFYEHIKRLIKSMKILKMEVPTRFTSDILGFEKEIFRLINKSKYQKSARIRLTIYRKSGGLYTPTTNEVNYLIKTEKLEHTDYQLNKEGLFVDTFDEIAKPTNILSNLKLTSSVFFVLAGIYKKENNLNECIILNNQNNIVEALSSNLFFVKDKYIYTPPLSSGCLNGIMRSKIIEIAKSLNYNLIDNLPLNINNLINADEIFLTNAISGIKWVLAFKQKRYYNKTSKILINKLNSIA